MDEHVNDWYLSLRDAGFQPDESHTRWKGTVSVEWTDRTTGENRTAEHYILIWLPPGFPYNAPAVLCYDESLLRRSWHMNAGQPATLCLWDNEHSWSPSFSARKLLKRVTDWFYYYHTDSWPLNSQMPDLYTYLERIGTVIIGEAWKPDAAATTGQFKLWYSPKHRSVFPDLASTHVDKDEPEARIAESIVVASDTVRMRGVWFRVPEPFVPPERLDTLLTIIDALTEQTPGWAVKQLRGAFGQKPAGKGMPIAIGYHDNQHYERWLFLWAEFPERNGKRFKWKTARNICQITVKSLQTAPAAKADLLRRSAYYSQPLTSRCVAVFGIGALGSSIALLLAKSGVGQLQLIDSDRLMPGNVMRHECGLQDVGFAKTHALKRTINRHNPDCFIKCFEETWEPSVLLSHITDADIVVDATGNTNFSIYLSSICVAHNRPVLFVAAYRRAAVGRVITRMGKNDPCLSCYLDDLSAWSDEEYPVIPENPEEHFIEDGCGSVTEEAVALDVEAVVNFAARRVLKILREEHDGHNLAIIVNEALPDIKAHLLLQQPGTILHTNNPRPSCPICR